MLRNCNKSIRTGGQPWALNAKSSQVKFKGFTLMDRLIDKGSDNRCILYKLHFHLKLNKPLHSWNISKLDAFTDWPITYTIIKTWYIPCIGLMGRFEGCWSAGRDRRSPSGSRRPTKCTVASKWIKSPEIYKKKKNWTEQYTYTNIQSSYNYIINYINVILHISLTFITWNSLFSQKE
jgi:hypothetical protein